MKAGDILKRIRRERKLTQASLSKLTGIDPATIRKYENGQYPLTEKAAKRIASALNINPDTFVLNEINASSAMHMLFLLLHYYGGEIKTETITEQDADGNDLKTERAFISFYGLDPLLKAWKQFSQKHPISNEDINSFSFLEQFLKSSDSDYSKQGDDESIFSIMAQIDKDY